MSSQLEKGSMIQPRVIPLDLFFQGLPGAIAAYLIPHNHGAVLVDCGPGSTLQSLQAALRSHGYSLRDITDVLLTHIHLDHAGSAGALARQGARIHIHPNGAAHLINPEKLLRSAARIYGDQIQTLWGEFLPVPEESLSVHPDGDGFTIEGLYFQALDTPGHANHHLVFLFDGFCFSGDIGGVRLAPLTYIRITTPPPEFHLEIWRLSLDRLRQERIRWIVPTHFGIFADPQSHLEALTQALDRLECWMDRMMSAEPSLEGLRVEIESWEAEQTKLVGIPTSLQEVLDLVSPCAMSADGIYRYWHKVRMSPGE